MTHQHIALRRSAAAVLATITALAFTGCDSGNPTACRDAMQSADHINMFAPIDELTEANPHLRACRGLSGEEFNAIMLEVFDKNMSEALDRASRSQR